MKPLVVPLACLALGFGASPALAFKNIEGCDIVAFASKGALVSIPPERWQAYRDSAEAILGRAPMPGAPLQAWRGLANTLIKAQASLLAPEKGSQALQDYLASDSCRVLARLDSGAIEALLGEVSRSAPQQAATALRQITEAARMQFDNIERTARFRSGKDRTTMAAQYYCFVAGAIVALLPPERREAVTLDDFGDTVSCKEIGRAPQGPKE